MSSARLFQTTGVEEQWHGVVWPWLRAQAERAWEDSRPTVILTPSRAESFYLRSRMVEEGLSSFGLRFWTPSDARKFLLQEIPLAVQPATEAELRLIARACAATAAEKSDEPSLTSVEREPGLFLRAYDLLLGAGWNPAKDGAAYSRALAHKVEGCLKERKIATQAGLHRLLWKRGAREPLLRSLLIVGFNATHWPLWDLLRTVVGASEDSTIGFLSPRYFAGPIDELWIGSWEEEIGAAVDSPEVEEVEIPAPFSGWVGSYERGVAEPAAECDLTFLATPDLAGQVKAVVLQALIYLGRESCQRLGIAFPEANALALGVAEELRRLGIPLDDGTGYWRPGVSDGRAWRAWLALQEEPSVQNLIAWVRAAEAGGLGCGASLPAREMAETLESALGETLIDDLAFLALHLGQDARRNRSRATSDFLSARIQLPETGTFAGFFDITHQAMQQLGWSKQAGLDRLEAPACLREAEWTLSRRVFLEWLREATDSRERTRGAESNHFYGKVHLLIYAQMSGQTWTHLILTGLNEGRWPRVSETGAFGSRHELAELNRQARALNRRGTGEGSQGAGHEAVRPERGYCLLPLERQDLALRDLCAAVEGTSESVCFTALTAEGGRTLLPSDFISAAYQAKTGRSLDEVAFSALAKTTLERCKANAGLFQPVAESERSREHIDSTHAAFAARRDAERPFGAYEFAFAEPPWEPIQLPCKVWETAWNHPAAVWLERIVGVSAWPEGELAWPRAVGTWVHRWLTVALRACHEVNTVENFIPLLRTAIDREPRRICEQMERAGVPLYPWWNHVWGQARAVALGLGESLVPHLPDCVILSEYELPRGKRIALPGVYTEDFELRGQIDLLRIESGAAPFDPARGNFADCTCWVIDFKTGAAKNLTTSRMEKGIGLQPMLYALAVRSMGAASIAVSLQTLDSPLKPQVQIEQIEANAALFRSLERMHRNGIFGMRPAPESDYGFSPEYPLATRPIAPATLEAKWALTHGAAALWEEA